MRAIANANLGLRFLLELGALAAVGYWGWQTADGVFRWLLAIGAVAAVAVVWGLFVSPKAAVPLARPLRLAIEFAVWTAAGAALYSADQPWLAVTFVAVAIVSGTLNYASRPR
jgi:hypothetical protein